MYALTQISFLERCTLTLQLRRFRNPNPLNNRKKKKTAGKKNNELRKNKSMGNFCVKDSEKL